jgi:hypothetical protein
MLMNTKSSDTERIANKLKEFRLGGENKAAQGGPLGTLPFISLRYVATKDLCATPLLFFS